MPFVLDPDEKIDVMLKADQAKPPERQMTFVFKHLSARDYRALNRLLDEAFVAADANKPEDEDAATEKAIKMGIGRIASGEKLPAGTIDSVIESLTVDERWELLIEWRKRLALGSAEKKASPSPLPSLKGSSAPAVATAPATASQPSPSPSFSLTGLVQCAEATFDACNAPTAEAGEKTCSSAAPGN